MTIAAPVAMRYARWVPWIFVVTLALWFMWRGNARVTAAPPDQHFGDFRHFFWAAEAVWKGENPYLVGEKHLEMDGKRVQIQAFTTPWPPPVPLSTDISGQFTQITGNRVVFRHPDLSLSTIIVPDDALITIDGKPASRADLKVGMIAVANGHPERNGYIYPPLVAFCYAPLAPLGITRAAAITMDINVLLLFGGILLLSIGVIDAFDRSRELSSPAQGPGLNGHAGMDRFFILGLIMAGTCLLGIDRIKAELQMLQTNATVFFMWSLGFYLLRKRPFLAGIALGFAFNVKYLVLPLLPYFILRRQWKAAGGMVAGIAFWGLLPATVVGLGRDLDYLKYAYSGMLRLVGIPVAGVIADVEPLDSGFSFSIPSGLARYFIRRHWDIDPLAIAACIGAVWLLGLALAYRRNGAPIIKPMNHVYDRPLAAAEYVALLGVTLAFSPQAGTRHAMLTIGIYVVGLAFVLLRPLKIMRWVLLASLGLATFGISFPPGQADGKFTGFKYLWREIGMPYWCILIACTVLLWTALRVHRAESRQLPESLP